MRRRSVQLQRGRRALARALAAYDSEPTVDHSKAVIESARVLCYLTLTASDRRALQIPDHRPAPSSAPRPAAAPPAPEPLIGCCDVERSDGDVRCCRPAGHQGMHRGHGFTWGTGDAIRTEPRDRRARRKAPLATMDNAPAHHTPFGPVSCTLCGARLAWPGPHEAADLPGLVCEAPLAAIAAFGETLPRRVVRWREVDPYAPGLSDAARRDRHHHRRRLAQLWGWPYRAPEPE